MGQSTSVDVQSGGSTPCSSLGRNPFQEDARDAMDFLHDQIRKHSLTLRQLTTLTFEDVQSKIKELNDLSSKFVDCNGKQLIFEMKEGSDNPSTVLWKGLIRVRCMKINPETKVVEKCRDLNLKQFLQVYNTMTQMHGTLILNNDTGLGMDKSIPEEEEDGKGGIDDDKGISSWDTELGEEAAKYTPVKMRPKKPLFTMSTSVFMDEIKSPTGGEECCICMETRPEVSLPCAHSYCLACIEQWNVNHKTCPICRSALENTDETWVLEDKPNNQDVQMEMEKSFFALTK